MSTKEVKVNFFFTFSLLAVQNFHWQIKAGSVKIKNSIRQWNIDQGIA